MSTPPIPQPLTPQQISTTLQAATIQILGLLNDPEKFSKVRIAWQGQGQPAWGISDGLCVIRAIEVDDDYNRIRDFNYSNGSDDTQVYEYTIYTRVWEAMWTWYGPSSFDQARILRSALYTQAAHDIWSAANLYVIDDLVAPMRVPEYVEKTGEWWERVDFRARFNEAVVEAPFVGTATNVEVIVNDAASSIAGTPLADFTVEE